MIENKVIHYKNSMMINCNGINSAFIVVPFNYYSFGNCTEISPEIPCNEICSRLINDFGFSDIKHIQLSLLNPQNTMGKFRFEYMAKLLPDIDETLKNLHLAKIKKITYFDGISIEVVDNNNAKAEVPKTYIRKIRPAEALWKSPLNLIMERLEKDFNFLNICNFNYHHFENDQLLFYNFHRNICE